MRQRTSRRIAAVVALLAVIGIPSFASAGSSAATQIRVNAFPGFSYLALYVADAKGFFTRRGLDVQIRFTPNSQEQREGLARGAFETMRSPWLSSGRPMPSS